jgi:hypothetical protein
MNKKKRETLLCELYFLFVKPAVYTSSSFHFTLEVIEVESQTLVDSYPETQREQAINEMPKYFCVYPLLKILLVTIYKTPDGA